MRRTLWVVPREPCPSCRRRARGRSRCGNGDGWSRRSRRAASRNGPPRGWRAPSEPPSPPSMLVARRRHASSCRTSRSWASSSRWAPAGGRSSRARRARAAAALHGGSGRAWASAQRPAPVGPVTAWLGAEIDLLEPERARAELLRAWLARFGPATETDIRWWAGWTAREARAAIGAVSHDVVDLDGAAGYVLEGDLDHVEPDPSAAPSRRSTRPRWAGRSATGTSAPGTHPLRREWERGPTVWWAGRVVGGWSQRPDGEIVWRLLEEVGADAERAIEAEAERLVAWLGDVRLKPLPSPSSGRWQERTRAGRRQPSLGRKTPSRSRAAGSARCPRRSGTASPSRISFSTGYSFM